MPKLSEHQERELLLEVRRLAFDHEEAKQTAHEKGLLVNAAILKVRKELNLPMKGDLDIDALIKARTKKEDGQ